jgi:hypothetical protein
VTAAVAITRGLLWWQQTILLALFIMLFAWAVIASYLATRPQTHASDVTTTNVESYVRQWLDNFELTTQKLPKSEQYHFVYLVSYPDTLPILVSRLSTRDQYVTVQGTVELSESHKGLYDKLSDADKKRFIFELKSEVSRAKIHTKWESPPLKNHGCANPPYHNIDRSRIDRANGWSPCWHAACHLHNQLGA